MRILIALCLLTLTSFVLAESPRAVVTATLGSALTATGTQAAVSMGAGSKTFQASMTVSSGSGTSAIAIEGSLDGAHWDSLGTLAVTETASDSITLLAPAYNRYRANVTGLTGTGAAVTITGGN